MNTFEEIEAIIKDMNFISSEEFYPPYDILWIKVK